MKEMNVESFNLDHTKVAAPIFASLERAKVSTVT